MPLKRIDGMPEQPYTCACCGQGPTTNEGEIKKVIWAEGVDIDWGNSLYICWDCAELVSDLCGRVTREGFDRLEKELEELRERHVALLEKYEEQEGLLDKIREGSRAQKRIKETAKS